MDDIRRVIRAARCRLMARAALSGLCAGLTAGVGALLVARLLERLAGVSVAWERVGLAAGVGAGVIALGWAIARRGSTLGVARTVDEHANLRDSLSTALGVESMDDPWSRAVVDSARARAKGVRLREALPIGLPRAWWHPLAAGIALLGVWFLVPRLERSAEPRLEEAVAQRTIEIEQRTAEAEAEIQKLLAQAGAEDLLGDAGEDAPEARAPSTPEEAQRAAIRSLSAASERIEEALAGEKGQTLADLQNRMNQLKQPGPGPATEMSRAMARGEFGKAEQALERLAQELAQGNLSDEQKQALESQMKNLAQQMQALAQQNQGLQNALQQAGMDAAQAQKLAASPEALKKALEAMQNLSPEQKQALVKMAQSAMQASQCMGGMGESMGQMAQGMGSPEGMQAMDALAEQLGQMEMLSQEMASMEAALSMAQSELASLSDMLGNQSWSQCNGGVPGQNAGKGGLQGGTGSMAKGPAEELPDLDLATQGTKAKMRPTEGRIIASRLVYGEQVRGESVAEFREAVAAASGVAADAIETNLVPREYQAAVKHYFGRLEGKVAPTGPAPDPAATPTPAPASTPTPTPGP